MALGAHVDNWVISLRKSRRSFSRLICPVSGANAFSPVFLCLKKSVTRNSGGEVDKTYYVCPSCNNASPNKKKGSSAPRAGVQLAPTFHDRKGTSLLRGADQAFATKRTVGHLQASLPPFNSDEGCRNDCLFTISESLRRKDSSRALFF